MAKTTEKEKDGQTLGFAEELNTEAEDLKKQLAELRKEVAEGKDKEMEELKAVVRKQSGQITALTIQSGQTGINTAGVAQVRHYVSVEEQLEKAGLKRDDLPSNDQEYGWKVGEKWKKHEDKQGGATNVDMKIKVTQLYTPPDFTTSESAYADVDVTIWFIRNRHTTTPAGGYIATPPESCNLARWKSWLEEGLEPYSQ